MNDNTIITRFELFCKLTDFLKSRDDGNLKYQDTAKLFLDDETNKNLLISIISKNTRQNFKTEKRIKNFLRQKIINEFQKKFFDVVYHLKSEGILSQEKLKLYQDKVIEIIGAKQQKKIREWEEFLYRLFKNNYPFGIQKKIVTRETSICLENIEFVCSCSNIKIERIHSIKNDNTLIVSTGSFSTDVQLPNQTNNANDYNNIDTNINKFELENNLKSFNIEEKIGINRNIEEIKSSLSDYSVNLSFNKKPDFSSMEKKITENDNFETIILKTLFNLLLKSEKIHPITLLTTIIRLNNNTVEDEFQKLSILYKGSFNIGSLSYRFRFIVMNILLNNRKIFFEIDKDGCYKKKFKDQHIIKDDFSLIDLIYYNTVDHFYFNTIEIKDNQVIDSKVRDFLLAKNDKLSANYAILPNIYLTKFKVKFCISIAKKNVALLRFSNDFKYLMFDDKDNFNNVIIYEIILDQEGGNNFFFNNTEKDKIETGLSYTHSFHYNCIFELSNSNNETYVSLRTTRLIDALDDLIVHVPPNFFGSEFYNDYTADEHNSMVMEKFLTKLNYTAISLMASNNNKSKKIAYNHNNLTYKQTPLKNKIKKCEKQSKNFYDKNQGSNKTKKKSKRSIMMNEDEFRNLFCVK